MINVAKRQYLKNNIIYKFLLKYDTINKIITVTCINITNSSTLQEIDNINEYRQVMFDEFTLTDLYFYGRKMLKKSELIEVKIDGTLKIFVPRIE